MGQFLIGLLALIKAMPDLLKILREIFSFFHEVEDYFERKDKVKDLKDAIVQANKTGDTTALDKLFGSKANDKK